MSYLSFTKNKEHHGLKDKLFFSCSTQLSTKFIMLINVKMPTCVLFISMLNATSESLKARKVGIFQQFSLMNS